MSSNTQKLRVLRARTDHDLRILVQRELDRGSALLDVAITRNSPAFLQAAKAQNTAAALLSRIAALDDADRCCIEARFNELRQRFDRVPAYANVPSYPASAAS